MPPVRDADDADGRTTKVTSKKADNTELANVSYAYDTFDNLTAITRGDGLKYALTYNAFRNLESIGITGKTDGALVRYTYKNGNGRLKAITYANGDTMKATYNTAGQMIAEKWYNASNTLTAHYKYVYDGDGNIVRSLDMTAKKEYTYTYENGNLTRAAEYTITVDADTEIITAKTLVNTVIYVYDEDGTLAKKRLLLGDDVERVVYYTNPGNGDFVVELRGGFPYFRSQSKADHLGRKEFDELQLGATAISRRFDYRAGSLNDVHRTHAVMRSTPTTRLVERIVFSDGCTIYYEYDTEERITSVVESYTVDGVTTTNTTLYTYDALGQLLTETVNGTVVNTMTYDNYGNIVSKNGVAYGYDTTWKDKMVSYGGQTISYDAQGNPTSYLGHTLLWEKGRQLKTFIRRVNNAPQGAVYYTYNANGIRTSKTIDATRHDFVLDGAKILKESWKNDSGVPQSLVPLYDNEDAVCGIVYNDVPYYFLKNLQGDIIAITDANATVVARYTYDAWGVPTITQDITTVGIATINPYRYRGYYYDSEIGMYYLQSRYYDPIVGRFVNGDEIEYLGIGRNDILSVNLLSYCENDFVNKMDPSGYVSKKTAENVIKNNAKEILKVKDKFNVDPAALAACIYAEQCLNVDWKDMYVDPVLAAFIDVSLGICQVKISTAILVEDKGYIPKTVGKRTLMRRRHGKIVSASSDRRAKIIKKLLNNNTCIQYAAAYLAYIQDLWKKAYPKIFKDPAILATLYNLDEEGNKEKGIHSNPKSNDFGKFAEKNYKNMKKLLGVK